MRDRDLDLFAVVEDGKLWAVLLGVTVWAKVRGLRNNICLNYVISDRALPLFETDAFTAQQAASLRPVFGKGVYDRFIELNPFIRRHFPNFDPARRREFYAEISSGSLEAYLERLLRLGPIQLMEALSRWVFWPYLKGKRADAEARGGTAVLLGRKWIKLHLHSHKEGLLRWLSEEKPSEEKQSEKNWPEERSAAHAVARSVTSAANQRQPKNVEIESQ